MIVCPTYEDLRMSLVSEAMLVNAAFEGYSDLQKLFFLSFVPTTCDFCLHTGKVSTDYGYFRVHWF